jgi:hypothetical protein
MPSFSAPPPDWDRREIPRYRITRETLPAPKSRFKTEPPFAQASDASIWQYGDRVYARGEEIESKSWPNPGTMIPLNESARKVLDFFNMRQKSRLGRSPWQVDRIVLDDGLTGTNQPKFNIKTGVTAA